MDHWESETRDPLDEDQREDNVSESSLVEEPQRSEVEEQSSLVEEQCSSKESDQDLVNPASVITLDSSVSEAAPIGNLENGQESVIESSEMTLTSGQESTEIRTELIGDLDERCGDTLSIDVVSAVEAKGDSDSKDDKDEGAQPESETKIGAEFRRRREEDRIRRSQDVVLGSSTSHVSSDPFNQNTESESETKIIDLDEGRDEGNDFWSLDEKVRGITEV